MRDRLIELIKEAKKHTKEANCDIEKNMLFADYLLANGVIVPPVSVGKRLYQIVKMPKHTFVSEYPIIVEPYQVIYKNIIGGTSCIPFEDFGKTVFLTKEEAENALKARERV